ncbi:MAG: type II restriction endonuclease [Pseudohongiella sp.]|nr:type II restriction endonuclease [Pseudohongiella sp.]
MSGWIGDIGSKDWRVFIKRLSANDTGATGGHQVGVYMPKVVLGAVFPQLTSIGAVNPDVLFTAIVDSHELPEQQLRAIYYNQGTRDEKRITRWATGMDYTPLQDKEMTGSLAIFAFHKPDTGNADFLRVWVCADLAEEEIVEAHIGELDPSDYWFGSGLELTGVIQYSLQSSLTAFPEIWKTQFPSGSEIIAHLFTQGFYSDLTADKRLIKRRDHEYKLFMSVESWHTMPLIKAGFENVNDFINVANSIANRRKSRSGKSLELHLEYIFKEEGLNDFGTQCKTEGNKRPDFIFPGCAAYHDMSYPTEKLRVLGVKTTVKDRWRQILNEARRIEKPFLFTLQNGVSVNQFQEMKDENVTLVVPAEIKKAFPAAIRDEIYSLDQFINETKSLY